ncbi:MAG: hypothetical protein F7C35_08800 [Desulfurococcales archaeon]|nr:hypothetical protein [Desulfurococcales archaeon]
MYTAPTALMSMLIVLPIVAGLSALLYSSLQQTALQLQEQNRYNAAEIAAQALRAELEENTSLAERAVQGSLTEGDLQYLERLAQSRLETLMGLPYRVNIVISVANTTYQPSEVGYEYAFTPGPSYKLIVRNQVIHWAYRMVRVGDYYVLVGAGV